MAPRNNYSRIYKNETFAKAIPGSAGIMRVIAQRVGCTWSTAYRRIMNNAKLRQMYYDEVQATVDMAESVILMAIKDGNVDVARWYLTNMRREVYGKTPVVQLAEHSEARPVKFVVTFANSGNMPLLSAPDEGGDNGPEVIDR